MKLLEFLQQCQQNDLTAKGIDIYKSKDKLYKYFITNFDAKSKLGQFDENNKIVHKRSMFLEYYFGSLWLIRDIIKEKPEAYC